MYEREPTLAFQNEHTQPIIHRRWEKLKTPLHMVAYALNAKRYMLRPSRVRPLQDDEVKVWFFRCIGKMYDVDTAGEIRFD